MLFFKICFTYEVRIPPETAFALTTQRRKYCRAKANPNINLAKVTIFHQLLLGLLGLALGSRVYLITSMLVSAIEKARMGGIDQC